MSNSRPSKAGTADPLDFRFARVLGGDTDTFRAGKPFVNATAVHCVVVCAGALLCRLRGKTATGGGTLSFLYLRPASVRDTDTSADCYSSAVVPPHADVAVVAGTEWIVDITPGGESEILVTFTPTADGTVTFFDGMQQ